MQPQQCLISSIGIASASHEQTGSEKAMSGAAWLRRGSEELGGLTFVSSFFPSSTTLPPAANRPPANKTSKSVSPYREKSSAVASRTCTQLGRHRELQLRMLAVTPFAQQVAGCAHQQWAASLHPCIGD